MHDVFIITIDIAMAACRGYRRAGDPHAGADNISTPLSVTERNNRFQIATDILHTCEAGHQGGPGVADPVYRPVGRRKRDILQPPVRIEFGKQVNVAVDQPGQDILIRQIDNFRAADFNKSALDPVDAFAGNDDGLFRNRGFARDRQQPACVDNGDIVLCEGHRTDQQCQKCNNIPVHDVSPEFPNRPGSRS